MIVISKGLENIVKVWIFWSKRTKKWEKKVPTPNENSDSDRFITNRYRCFRVRIFCAWYTWTYGSDKEMKMKMTILYYLLILLFTTLSRSQNNDDPSPIRSCDDLVPKKYVSMKPPSTIVGVTIHQYINNIGDVKLSDQVWFR